MLFFKQWPVSYNTPYEKIGDEVRSLADEVPFDIPDSWEWVRLGSIGETNIGLTYKPSDVTSDGVPVLRSNNIQNGQMDYSELLYVSCTVPERAYAHKGDILICARNGSRALVGKSAIVDADGMAFGAFMAIYRSPCNPYIQLFINSYLFRGQLEGATTTTINQVTQEMLKRQLCPLPPIQEQLRIVQKYTELQPSIAAYSNAYDKAQILSKAFPEALKKSILQEAVQGKLVPQDPSDEPAEVLLERIQAEKQRLIKEGKIKRDKHESIIFRRDNSHYEKRGAEAVCIDDEIPFEIPENWTWARLSSASVSIADGDHQPPPQVQDGIPFLVISNVSDGRVDFSNTRYVPKEYFASLADIRIPQRGDLLFTVTGSYGIVIPVQTERKFCFQRHIALIKLSCLSPEFMRLWLSAPLVYEQCRKSATGTAQKTVGLASLKGLLIPIPPLNEQMRIIQKLNTLLALAAL